MMRPLDAVDAAVRQPPSRLSGEVEDVPLDDDSGSECSSEEGGPSGPPLTATRLPGSSPDGHPPNRVMASRGLTGMLEGAVAEVAGESGGPQDEQIRPNSVFLNVYDVSESELIQRVNRIFTADDTVLAGGVFHAGVEIYGKEWCYGATVPGRTGVGAVLPRMHPQHRYRATVHMGHTDQKPEEISRLLAGMAEQWRGCEYNLIHHNCLSFCNVLLGKLGLRRIPGWVDRAARAASQVDNVVKAVRSISSEEVQGQAAEALQNIRTDSLAALSAAREESQKLFELAQEQAQQDLSEVHGGVQELGAKATELAGIAQEQLQSVGASLWQWGQELQTTVGIADASATPALSDLSKQAEDNIQAISDNIWTWGRSITKDLQQSLEGPKSRTSRKDPARKSKRSEQRRQQTSQSEVCAEKPAVAAAVPQETQQNAGPPRDLLGDLSDEDEQPDASSASRPFAADPRGTAGLIRAQETSLLKQSLLDDQDDDDDAEEVPTHVFRRAEAPQQRPVVARRDVEAPADWSSCAAAPAVATKAPVPAFDPPSRSAATAPTVEIDLLDAWDKGLTPTPAAALATAAAPKEASVDLLS